MRTNVSALALAGALLSSGSAASAAGVAPGYTIQILQPLPGYGSTSPGSLEQQSQGLNDLGQTVGRSQGALLGQPLAQFASIWDVQGNPTPLATPGGAFRSRGYDINNKGEVVGTIQTGPDFPDNLRATYWAMPGTYQYLLPDTGTYTEALRINDNSWIMGFYLTAAGDDPTTRISYVRRADGTRFDVAPVTPGGVVFLFELNNANAAFGTEFEPGFDGDTGAGEQRAVRWTEAGGLEYLPKFGDQDIAGFGSAAGIAGVTFDLQAGSPKPYRYRPDLSIMPLGELADARGSDAGFSINDSGLQVGVTYTCGDFDVDCAIATIWDAGGNPYDLNSLAHSAYKLLTAYSINDQGMIFGDAISPGGVRFAYLARPVPEPATWAMMVSGFGLVGAAFRRRRRVKFAS